MSCQFQVHKAYLWLMAIAGLALLTATLIGAPDSEHSPADPGPHIPWATSSSETTNAEQGSPVVLPSLIVTKTESLGGIDGWLPPPALADFLKSRDSSYLTPEALQKLKQCAADCIDFLSAAATRNADNPDSSMAILSWLASGRSPGAFVALAAVSGQLELLNRLPREHQVRLDTLARELATSPVALERQDWSELAKLQRIGDVVGLNIVRHLDAGTESQSMVLSLVGATTSADEARSLLRLGGGDLWFEALGNASVLSNPLAMQATLDQLASYHQSDWLDRLQILNATAQPMLTEAVARTWAPAQLSGERLQALDRWLATTNLDASTERLANTLLQFAEDQTEAAVIRARRGIVSVYR